MNYGLYLGESTKQKRLGFCYELLQISIFFEELF